MLKGISLTFEPGEFVALIGQNGAGKTTLAKHLNGVYRPGRGRVLVGGLDTSGQTIASLAGQVGYCYQNPDHQIFQQTLYDEVAFGPRNQGLSAPQVEERVQEALTAVGLWAERAEAPHFASKGERQRIAVASVLAMRPEVIVLDEPTTGLDWAGSREMMTLVRNLNEAGASILMITHDMRLVADYARRVVVLGGGRVLFDGTPRSAFAQAELLAEAGLRPPQASQLSLALQPAVPPALEPASLADRFEVVAESTPGCAVATAVAYAGVEAAGETAAAAAGAGGREAKAGEVANESAGAGVAWAGGTHPTARLLLFVSLALLPFATQAPLALLAVLALNVLAASRGGMPRSGWRLWSALGAVGGVMTFLTWLPFISGGRVLFAMAVPGTRSSLALTSLGLSWSVAMGLRIAAAALACVAYVATTPPRQITIGLRGLGVPYPLAFLVSLAFRLLPLSQHDAAMIREAQAVRGLDLDRGSLAERARRYAAILGPLVLTALRRVQIIANSLDARGFRLRGGRHRIYRMPAWHFSDLALTLGAVGLVVLVFYLKAHGIGVLLPDRL